MTSNLHLEEFGNFQPMLAHCAIPCNGALPCLKICDCPKRRMWHREDQQCTKMSDEVGRQLWSHHDHDLAGNTISLKFRVGKFYSTIYHLNHFHIFIYLFYNCRSRRDIRGRILQVHK